MKLAIIGAGNMACALLGGIINERNLVTFDMISVSSPNEIELKSVSKQYKVKTSINNTSIVEDANVILLAIKPQIMQQVCEEIGNHIAKDTLILSVAAGISIDALRNWMKTEATIIRCMPNTPALIGQGATGLYAPKGVDYDSRKLAENILSTVGITEWVTNESLLDVITALSGSGPAYFFYLAEQLIESAVALGLPQDLATRLALQTGSGAMALAKDSNEPLTDLRKRVTSLGGTTECAIQSLDTHQVDQHLREALNKAYHRAQALQH